MCGVGQGYAVCCRWIFFLVTIGGFVMSMFAAASCRFVEYVDSNGVPQAAGFYRFHDPSMQQCVRYGEESSVVEFDESERAARTAALLAPLLALGSLVLVVVEFCCCRIVCSRILEGTALLAAVVLQGITFLWIDSTTFCGGDLLNELLHQKPCTLGDGAAFSVVALLCYFASGALLCCTPKPEPVLLRNHDIERKKSSSSYKDNDDDDNYSLPQSRVEKQTAELQMNGKFDPEWA